MPTSNKHPTLTTLATPVHRNPTPTPEEIMKEFPTVFNGQIKTMKGEEFHISLTDNAKPFCVKTPRSIPFAYRDKRKAELDRLQKQGIIALSLSLQSGAHRLSSHPQITYESV